jgi:hypothetical protein
VSSKNMENSAKPKTERTIIEMNIKRIKNKKSKEVFNLFGEDK